MSTYKIAVIVGSLRAGAYNLRLARALEKLMPEGFSFDYVEIGDLPLYNQDLEADMPAPVVRLKRQVESAQGVLFATPEYNRSLPGVLKNAIDWASRPYGKSSWNGKPSGVVGASPGAIGTAMAQQHLRNILAYLDMPTLNQPEVYLQVQDGTFGPDGRLADAGVEELLRSWMDRFAAWVKAHAPQHV